MKNDYKLSRGEFVRNTAAIGRKGIKPLEENYRLTLEIGEKGMVAAVDRKELARRLAPLAGPHALCWARPDYNDGITT